MEIDIVDVLTKHYKGLEYSLKGNPANESEFNAKLTIHKTNGVETPTWAKVQSYLTEMKTAYANNKYQRERKPNYPPMTDYLDGIVKGDQAQVDKYIADCLAVKEKYPKGDN